MTLTTRNKLNDWYLNSHKRWMRPEFAKPFVVIIALFVLM